MDIENFVLKNVPVNKDGFTRDFLILKECSDDLSIREFIAELESLLDDYDLEHEHIRMLFSLSLCK